MNSTHFFESSAFDTFLEDLSLDPFDFAVEYFFVLRYFLLRNLLECGGQMFFIGAEVE